MKKIKLLVDERQLWFVMLYEIMLIIPAYLIKSTYGSLYLFYVPLLCLGTVALYAYTLFVVKGNERIVLYTSLLISWGTLVVLQHISSEKVAKRMWIYIILFFAVPLVLGKLFMMLKWLRYDFMGYIYGFFNVFLLIVTCIWGVGPGGRPGEAKTSLNLLGQTIMVVDIIKVLYVFTLVILLCKEKLPEDKKNKRLRISGVLTLINMFGMLWMNELGTLLSMLLLYVAFVIIYVRKIWKTALIGCTGAILLIVGIMLGEGAIDRANENMTVEELDAVFFNPEVRNVNGYCGRGGYITTDKGEEEWVTGTVNQFRPYLLSYLNEKASENDRQQEYLEYYSLVNEEADNSMRTAMQFIFEDPDDKIEFLNSAFFSRVYYYYGNVSENASWWHQFYLPKYTKLRTRLYCFMNPEWDLQNDGHQYREIRKAIANGGLLGNKELEECSVANAESDMVLVAITEVYGVVTVVIVLFIFFLLFIEGVKIALETKQTFNSGMAMGISLMIWIQVLFMFMCNSGMFPIVGVPVPFVSHGSISKLVFAGLIGMLIMMSAKQMPEVTEEDAQSMNRILVYWNYYIGRSMTRNQNLLLNLMPEEKVTEENEE